MASITDIICAATPEAYEAACAALRKANSEAPSDREVLQNFVANCTTLDGVPLTLDDEGAIVTLQ